MRILQTDAADGLSHVEEILHGEVVLFLLKPAELTYLRQPFVHLTTICGKGHLIHLFLAQCTETTLLQQSSDFVETYLMFEVVRINHAAKLHILRRICKKFF